VHQVGSKDSGSQKFTFLALKGKAVGVTQILYTTAATTNGKKIIAQIMLVIHEKSRKMKISEFLTLRTRKRFSIFRNVSPFHTPFRLKFPNISLK
jgi:hypothetical protein